jgi:rRNA biogenesis protein RRP5
MSAAEAGYFPRSKKPQQSKRVSAPSQTSVSAEDAGVFVDPASRKQHRLKKKQKVNDHDSMAAEDAPSFNASAADSLFESIGKKTKSAARREKMAKRTESLKEKEKQKKLNHFDEQIKRDFEKKQKKLKDAAELSDSDEIMMDDQADAEVLARSKRDITFKELVSGCGVVGLVHHVEEDRLVLQLASRNFIGDVSLSEVSDFHYEDEEDEQKAGSRGNLPKLNRLYKSGDLVVCAVLGIEEDESKKRLELSMRASVLNRNLKKKNVLSAPGLIVNGCIDSVEDHGYVVDIGIAGVKGFLSKDKLSSADSGFIRGRQVSNLRVTWTKPEHGTVGLEFCSGEVHERDSSMAMNFLAPGSVVTGTLERIAGKREGYVVSLFDGIQSVLSPSQIDLSDLSFKPDVKDTFTVRIIFVNYEEKIVRVSVKKTWVENSEKHKELLASRPLMKLGVCTGSVLAPLRNGSVLIQIKKLVADDGSAEEEFPEDMYPLGMIRVIDFHNERQASRNIAEGLKKGDEIEARAYGFDRIECLPLLSAKKEDIASSHDSIKAGKIVEAIVEGSDELGLKLLINSKTKAFCPIEHCAEIVISHQALKKKFPLKMKVKCRVLSILKPIQVTLKKNLLLNDLPIITRVKGELQVTKGMITRGYITRIDDKNGVEVGFFAGLTGWISALDLRINGFLKEFSSFFQVGQVLKVRVAAVIESERRFSMPRILLSLGLREKKESQSASHRAGDIVEGTVLGYSRDYATIRFESGKLGMLNYKHLTDFDSHVQAKKKWFQDTYEIGSVVKDLVVLRSFSNSSVDRKLLLTMKPSFVHLARQGAVPSTKEVFQKGDCFPAYVSNINEKGVLVSFFEEATGYLGASFLETLNIVPTDLQIHQTVFVSVTNVEREGAAVLVSCSIQNVLPKLTSDMLSALATGFQQEVREVSDQDVRFATGSIIKAQVDQISPKSVNLRMCNDATKAAIAAHPFNTQEVDISSLSQGDAVFVQILEEGIAGSLYDVKLVASSQVSDVKMDINEDREIAPEIVLIKDDHLVVQDSESKTISLAVWPFVQGMKKYLKLGNRLPGTLMSGSSTFLPDYSKVLNAHIAKEKNIKGTVTGASATELDIKVNDFLMGQLSILGLRVDELRELKLLQAEENCVSKEDMLSRAQKLIGLELDVKLHGTYFKLNKKRISIGDVCLGEVSLVAGKNVWANVNLGEQKAVLHITNAFDTYIEHPFESMDGKLFLCRVIPSDRDIKLLHVSTRVSSLKLFENVEVKNKGIRDANDSRIVKKMIVSGFIRAITKAGLVVFLNSSLCALVLKRNMGDVRHKNLDDEFEVGQLVQAKVVGDQNGTILLSMKNQALQGKDLSSQKVGSIVDCTVQRVKEFGVFLTIDGTNITGLCYKTNVSDEHIENLESMFSAGDKVKAIILSKNEETGKLKLATKRSLFQSAVQDETKMEVDNNDESEDEEEDEIVALDQAPLTNDFVWGESVEQDAEPSQEDVEMTEEASSEKVKESVAEVQAPKPKSRKRKLSETELRDEEKELTELEKSLADPSRGPQNADDYERLLLANPNSSALWIRYMAYYIHIHEIDQARAVAERALTAINFRDESEKLDMWIALLNLENMYGTVASMNQVFERALKVNDPKRIYLQTAKIYENTKKNELAESVYTTLTRKFGESSKVWTNYGEMRFAQGNTDAARGLLKRALRALPKRKHIKVTVKFGLLEYKFGNVERARTVFDGVLDNFPKRTDLWSVYIDQELKVGDQDYIRALFERTIGLKLAAKKMKLFFKKYLEYEQQEGDEERVEYVKDKAREFVQSQMEA